MSRDTTLLERASAEKALAALVGENAGDVLITGDALKSALANVLARKLGRTAPPLPTSERMPDQFERFFDVIFDVAMEEKPLTTETVIELAQAAVKILREEEARERASGDVDELASMYGADADDYEKMIALLKSGDTGGAVAAYSDMDTAARERLFGRTKQEQFELSIFLGQNGY